MTFLFLRTNWPCSRLKTQKNTRRSHLWPPRAQDVAFSSTGKTDKSLREPRYTPQEELFKFGTSSEQWEVLWFNVIYFLCL